MAAGCQPINHSIKRPSIHSMHQAVNRSMCCIFETHQYEQTSALFSGITGLVLDAYSSLRILCDACVSLCNSTVHYTAQEGVACRHLKKKAMICTCKDSTHAQAGQSATQHIIKACPDSLQL